MKKGTAAGTTLPLIDDNPSSDCADPSLCPPGTVNRHCRHCRLRDIRNGPAFWASEQKGAMSRQYRLQLMAEFGKDFLNGHKIVKGIK